MVTTSPSRNFLTDDAPFEGAAREWVNGYLAGLSAVVESDRARASANAGPDPDAPPLTILYGSQSGTSEALSKQLKKRGVATGYNPAVSTLDGFDFDALPEVKHLLVVCSTFGEGDPPDNAQKFTDWILSDAAPRLEGVSYSVCAMGDRSYTHFCKSGTDLDERMAELGATRLTDCVTCDVGYEDDFAAWSEAVFTSDSIVENAGDPPSGLVEEEEAAPTGWDKNNPYYATLLESRNLSADGSAKEVNHVEILLSGLGTGVRGGRRPRGVAHQQPGGGRARAELLRHHRHRPRADQGRVLPHPHGPAHQAGHRDADAGDAGGPGS